MLTPCALAVPLLGNDPLAISHTSMPRKIYKDCVCPIFETWKPSWNQPDCPKIKEIVARPYNGIISSYWKKKSVKCTCGDRKYFKNMYRLTYVYGYACIFQEISEKNAKILKIATSIIYIYNY